MIRRTTIRSFSIFPPPLFLCSFLLSLRTPPRPLCRALGGRLRGNATGPSRGATRRSPSVCRLLLSIWYKGARLLSRGTSGGGGRREGGRGRGKEGKREGEREEGKRMLTMSLMHTYTRIYLLLCLLHMFVCIYICVRIFVVFTYVCIFVVLVCKMSGYSWVIYTCVWIFSGIHMCGYSLYLYMCGNSCVNIHGVLTYKSGHSVYIHLCRYS